MTRLGAHIRRSTSAGQRHRPGGEHATDRRYSVRVAPWISWTKCARDSSSVNRAVAYAEASFVSCLARASGRLCNVWRSKPRVRRNSSINAVSSCAFGSSRARSARSNVIRHPDSQTATRWQRKSRAVVFGRTARIPLQLIGRNSAESRNLTQSLHRQHRALRELSRFTIEGLLRADRSQQDASRVRQSDASHAHRFTGT